MLKMFVLYGEALCLCAWLLIWMSGFMFYNTFQNVSYKQCFSFTSVRCGCHDKKQKNIQYSCSRSFLHRWIERKKKRKNESCNKVFSFLASLQWFALDNMASSRILTVMFICFVNNASEECPEIWHDGVFSIGCWNVSTMVLCLEPAA